MTLQRPSIFLALFVFCLLIGILCGQVHAADPNGSEADHDALRTFKVLFEEAINTNQLELLESHLHTPYSVVTYTDREFTDFETFKAQWQTTRDAMLQGGTYSVELLPDRSLIYDDIAIAKGDSENVLVTGSGTEHRFTSKWTVVFRKVDGEWKILRVHSSLNPFSNSMMESHVRGIIFKSVVAALLAGVVVGWIVRLLIARKKTVGGVSG